MDVMGHVERLLQFLEIEDQVAVAFKHLRPLLPAMGRFLLVVTFLEDAWRMVKMWDDQHAYFSDSIGDYGATSFLLYNIAAQVIGSLLVMSKHRVEVGVALLASNLFVQAGAYSLFLSLQFVLRVLSVCGGLMLVLADSLFAKKNKRYFADLPQLDQETKAKYLQLFGRILLVSLCMSIMVGGGSDIADLSPLQIALVAVGTIMCIMVVLGFKAKITSVVLLVGLSFANVVLNGFWVNNSNDATISAFSSSSGSRDVVQYDFFQTLSVLGGFILLALLGPGEMSVDERKKTL